MPDTLKDVVAALCQVARDYSGARLRADQPASGNWKTVFAVVLASRLGPAGRGAALAAFRAEDCPGVKREYADELAPPPPGTVSLSSSTVRWLAEISGTDLASLLPHPPSARDAYLAALPSPLGRTAMAHSAVASRARDALANEIAAPGRRVDLPLSSILGMAAIAEATANPRTLGQANPWPKGTRERDLWGLVRQWEMLCRELDKARAGTSQDWDRASREMSSFTNQVSDYLVPRELEWVKKVGFELCALPRGATYSPPPIRVEPPRDRLVMGPQAPLSPVPSPRSRVTVPVSASAIPTTPRWLPTAPTSIPAVATGSRWFPTIGPGLRTSLFPAIFT